MHASQWLSVLILDLSLFFLVPFSSCDDSRYDDCSPFKCGDIEIRYPFKVDSKPDYCSFPGFMVFCEDDEPILRLHSDNYSVRHIDYDHHNLSIVEEDFESNSCPLPDHNVTLESSPYYFTSQLGNLSFFHCTVPISIGNLFPIPCLSKESSFVFFTQLPEIQVALIFESCRAPVVVPVMAWALRELLSASLNISEALQQGFGLNWGEDICGDCERSGGRCGYDSSRPEFLCFCRDGDYPAICGRKARIWVKVVVGSSAAFGSVLLAGLLLVVCVRMSKLKITTRVWKNPKRSRDFENFIENHRTQMPERYSYSDIRKMTNYLKSKLGAGGFGSVFRGQLLDGRPVAVKILSDSKGKGEDFINEVAAISRTSHVNIVRLVGFCFQGSHRALVYEFMANGSLEKFIFDKNPKHGPLGWEKLFQIALGIARGLEYLHRGCNMRILHFDIKPHNILLDQDFCPKISDFGLAKLCPDKESIVSMTTARGTMGYIAPEVIYRRLGGVSQKSDVYSYGMLLLEMVGGRKNIDAGVENTSEIYFPDWIYNRLNKNRNLQLGDYIAGTESETARKLIMVGLWCIQTKPMDRPTMSKVVEMLEGNLQVLQMPPKPFLYSLSEAE